MTEKRYLIFESGGTNHALLLEDVAEIIDPPVMYLIPKAPPYYCGLINCHGRPTPVVDMGLMEGGDAAGEAGKILVLDRKTANLGLLVERVIDIVSSPIDPGEDDVDIGKVLVPVRLLETLEKEIRESWNPKESPR